MKLSRVLGLRPRYSRPERALVSVGKGVSKEVRDGKGYDWLVSVHSSRVDSSSLAYSALDARVAGMVPFRLCAQWQVPRK
jgi:hypothetical protein